MDPSSPLRTSRDRWRALAVVGWLALLLLLLYSFLIVDRWEESAEPQQAVAGCGRGDRTDPKAEDLPADEEGRVGSESSADGSEDRGGEPDPADVSPHRYSPFQDCGPSDGTRIDIQWRAPQGFEHFELERDATPEFQRCLCSLAPESRVVVGEAPQLAGSLWLVVHAAEPRVTRLEFETTQHVFDGSGATYRSECLYDLTMAAMDRAGLDYVPVNRAPQLKTPRMLYEECEDRVELPSTEGECETDDDCKAAGCNREVCVSAENAPKVVTTCEGLACFAVLDTCGCVDGTCTWSLLDAVSE